MESEKKPLSGLQPTSLVGREEVITAIKNQLFQNDVRLLTLIGTAGVGKTRLAKAILQEISPQFVQTVFVDLAPIRNPARVLQTIAISCDVIAGSVSQLLACLVKAIGSRRVLLILDNCEHILDGLSSLVTLLSSCPNLTVLTTSRETIKLKWEHVFTVPPLAVPELRELGNIHTIALIPSVALLIQRVKARKPQFTLTPQNVRVVAELCVRLDGIPLAIELAATQVGAIGFEDMLQNLGQRLIQEISPRDAPEHHKTMRAAIDWSYRLLNPKEKILLGRLSIFPAGWTLQSAEAICTDEELNRNEIPLLLERLVDCSLVMIKEQTNGSQRYHLPEIIREYSKDRLKDTGKEEVLFRRHHYWFLKWAEQRELNSWGPGMLEWLEQIDTDFHDFWLALEWYRSNPGEHLAGLLLWAAISRFWDIRGHFIDGLAMAKDLLQQVPDHCIARARTLVQASILARSQGDGISTMRLAEESLVLSRELNDVLDATAALVVLGSLAQAARNMERAETIFQEAINLAATHRAQDPRALYIALFWQGQFYCLINQNNRALAIFDEALSLVRQQGDSNFIGLLLIGKGRILLGLGDTTQAFEALVEGLGICQKLDYHELTAYCLEYLGQVAWAQKKIQRAIRLTGAAAALRTCSGIITWVSDPVHVKIIADLGEESIRSSQHFAEGLSLNETIKWALGLETWESDLPGLESGSGELDVLTSRELEIASLITRGLNNRQIAEKLYVSNRTVDAHTSHIFNKLKVNSRAQVSAWFTVQQSKTNS